MTPALPHRLRLWAILIATLVDLAALAASHLGVAPELLGELRPTIETGLTALLLVLVPALGDAYLVERRRRTPGVPALPDDAVLEEARGWPEPPTRPDRPSRLPPAGLGLVLVVLAAALSVVTSGCGAGALGTQADLVALGGIAAARADEALTRARARELDRIVESAEAECGQDGCSEDRAAHYRAELALAEERWAPALECRAPVVEALRAWGDGIETAHRAATDEIGTELLIHLGLRFVSSYSALRSCVNAAATDVDIPALPAPLSGLAGAR